MNYGFLVMVILATFSGGGAQNLGDRCLGENGKVGTCVLQTDCPSVDYIILATNYYGHSNQGYNMRSFCSMQNNGQIIICCANSSPHVVTTTVTQYLRMNHIVTATSTHFATTTVTDIVTQMVTPIVTPTVNHIVTATSTHFATTTVTHFATTTVTLNTTPMMNRFAKATATHIVTPTATHIATPMASSQEQFLLPERCGIQRSVDIIVRGKDVPLGSWPWIAILRGTVKGRRKWFCGGNLISDRYVLTAAHCVRSKIQRKSVRLGEHDLGQSPDYDDGVVAPEPQDIPVESVIVHPFYNIPCNHCNDIAILRLSKKAILNDYVMPICLPLNLTQDIGFSAQDFTGKYAMAAGWGSIDLDPLNHNAPDVLQEVHLRIQRNDYCKRLMEGYDPSTVICAGGEGKDTCRGDSGGPLTLPGINNTKQFLVGITSKGPRQCGVLNTSGLYTSVSHYMPWIMRNLQP